MSIYTEIINRFNQYNPTDDILNTVLGLDSSFAYQAIILAPSWKPEQVFKNNNPIITLKRGRSYYSSYEVNIEGKRYGYIITGGGSGTMLDRCLPLGSSKCNNIFFIGDAGALVNDINVGDIVTPKYSIAGDGGSLYLHDRISVENFRKTVYPQKESIDRLQQAALALNITIGEKVHYCTDSIICEYYHLDDILSLGSETIDCETSSFIRCMELMGKNSYVLHCVSDNLACGKPLFGRSEADREKCYLTREKLIPDLIITMS